MQPATASSNPQLASALAQFRQAVAEQSSNAGLFCQLGRFFWQSGQTQEFQQCLDHAGRILNAAIAQRDIEAALQIELMIFNHLVTTEETEEHYYRAFSLWRDNMAALGRMFRRKEPSSTSTAFNPKRIAFIVHTGVVLGHTEVMFNYLEGLRAHNPLGIEPRIYLFGSAHPEFLQRAQAVNVPVVIISPALKGFAVRLLAMREQLRTDGYGVAVWVCVPTPVIFIFAARLAPVQIYWSLKFHAVHTPDIDGYVTYGNWSEEKKTFNGQEWDICPAPFALNYPLPSQAEVEAFRKPYGDAFILGVLSRPEKINNPDYLDAVCAILKDNPNTVFLWTGRTKHTGIEEHFTRNSVGDRCHFIGWVDTKIAAASLDLFLETFPNGCGITGLQAMKSRTPLLALLGPLTLFGIEFWHDYTQGKAAYDFTRYPILAAQNTNEYRTLANRLIRDANFRNTVIAGEQEYFQRKISNTAMYTERFFNTLQGIITRTINI